MVDGLAQKRDAAVDLLGGLDSVIVAFSGGVDSTLVAVLAKEALHDRAVAAIGVSPSLPEDELRDARVLAGTIGIELLEVGTRELEDPRYATNPANRCYFCKTELFGALAEIAQSRGVNALVDGYNADDAGEILFGRRAANEHNVRSPLFEAGLTKVEVREISRAAGLPTADKPAAACLASRFPVGMEITVERLRQVELAERYLHGLGVSIVRVRHHGPVARIETDDDGASIVMAHRGAIEASLRDVGFLFVTLDLAGYRRGSTALPVRSSATHERAGP